MWCSLVRSLGGILNYCFLQDRIAKVPAEFSSSSKVDLSPAKQGGQFALKSCHAQVADRLAGLELHQNIDVAGVGEVVRQYRSEQG